MDEWLIHIYRSVNNKHEELNLSDGMDIFHSPVYNNPKMLIVGDNPGGSGPIIQEEPPEVDYYFIENTFELAKVMRDLFSNHELTEILKKSVKTNRVFFQSKDIDELRKKNMWGESERWCFNHLETIIKNTDPEYIFALSIGAYWSLINNLKGNHVEDLVKDGSRVIMRLGKIGEKSVIGIYHPSAKWTKSIIQRNILRITDKLKQIIINS